MPLFRLCWVAAAVFGFAVISYTAAMTFADEVANSTPRAAAQAKPAIGDKVAAMTFKDMRFLPRSLGDFIHPKDLVNKQAFVLIFTNATCPLVRKYLPRLKGLEQQYRGNGVQFIAVNVGNDDSILDIATQMVQAEAEFPFVKDIDGSCVRACGVERTPECVLIDANFKLRYRGRIDDQFRLSGTAPAVTKRELQDAIEALVAGHQIVVTETLVDGCRITSPVAAKPSDKFTYADHVAGLVERHCVRCHQPGTAAPFSLLTYHDVSSNAEMIVETVSEGRMPPWYASPVFGKFENDRSMPQADRDMLVDWVRSGMKKGDLEKSAAAPRETNHEDAPAKDGKQDDDRWAKRTWQLGQPDVIYDVPGTFEVPADGYVDYKYSAVPQMFFRDAWIQGAEILPDNPRVVHHANLGFVSISGNIRNAKLITGYVPGGGPMVLDGGVAAKIPAGSLVGLQIHLTTTGQPETVRLRVGFKYPRENIQQELRHLDIHNKRFAIEPFAPAHVVKASRSLSKDSTIYGFFAHMHNRGRDITWTARLPDGHAQTLLMIPNYSFDWQLPYYAPKGQMRLPAGTKIDVVAHFDNTSFNPYNPDPSKTVRFGQQTFEEMMYGYVFYTEDAERLELKINPKTGLAEE
ncbi:MAG: redoxin family protein [Pirellulales bacterium]|nr:redoxin family protein [Pirellulales bacterium]